jgi:hypothetical protein
MHLWEDPRLHLPEEVAVGMARLAGGMVEKVVEMALSGGLGLLAVGAGNLMPDACRDLGECEPESVPPCRAAA